MVKSFEMVDAVQPSHGGDLHRNRTATTPGTARAKCREALDFRT